MACTMQMIKHHEPVSLYLRAPASKAFEKHIIFSLFDKEE